MSANETLSKIPVIEEHVPGATTLGPARRYMQIATLILLVLIPASGLFRIDVAAGGVLMWDRLVWFSDMFIIMGFLDIHRQSPGHDVFTRRIGFLRLDVPAKYGIGMGQ